MGFKLTYWVAPSARPHLHVPGVEGGEEVCLKLIPQVTPLNLGELKVKEGTHRTKPMRLLGGEVGLEKHTLKKSAIPCNNITACYLYKTFWLLSLLDLEIQLKWVL